MSEWIGFFKLALTLSFVLAMAVLFVFSMPRSPLRDALMPVGKLAFAVLCGVLLVSPIDFLPEAAMGPFGLVDDIGYIVAGFQAVRTAFSKPKEQLPH